MERVSAQRRRNLSKLDCPVLEEEHSRKRLGDNVRRVVLMDTLSSSQGSHHPSRVAPWSAPPSLPGRQTVTRCADAYWLDRKPRPDRRLLRRRLGCGRNAHGDIQCSDSSWEPIGIRGGVGVTGTCAPARFGHRPAAGACRGGHRCLVRSLSSSVSSAVNAGCVGPRLVPWFAPGHHYRHPPPLSPLPRSSRRRHTALTFFLFSSTPRSSLACIGSNPRVYYLSMICPWPLPPKRFPFFFYFDLG
jgi:hypothetical protein